MIAYDFIIRLIGLLAVSVTSITFISSYKNKIMNNKKRYYYEESYFA